MIQRAETSGIRTFSNKNGFLSESSLLNLLHKDILEILIGNIYLPFLISKSKAIRIGTNVRDPSIY